MRDDTGHTGCPKLMTFGPCGGVRDDGGCEMDGAHRCVFAALTAPVPYVTTHVEDPPIPIPSRLLDAIESGPVVLTDFTLPPFDADAVTSQTAIMRDSCDAFLVGEHQNRPDFPPTLMASLISRAGGVPWITLACRDRNRLVLEQELAGLHLAGADGMLCLTGDGRAPGVRPGVTQVFDLEGTELAELAARIGHAVAVPESPEAVPQHLRPGRLVQKQAAGARLAILNHVSSAALVADFLSAARDQGLAIPVIASVAVYTDATSARVLQAFPGLHLDPYEVERVLASSSVRQAGIDAAVAEAERLLSIDGVAGVNLSGRGTSSDERLGAEVKAEVGHRVRQLW